jgi:hypothetical protein
MRSSLIAFIVIMMFACKKEQAPIENFSEASYQLTITGKWTSPSFTVPSSAHFTYFSGAVHNNNATMWTEGSLASAGVETIAESGNQFPLFAEVDAMIMQKTAIGQVNMPPPDPQGSISRTVYCNSNFSYLSFASMIAPSPDWFIGVRNVNLYGNKQWLTDTTIQLYVYDAGTEDGDVFGYNNPATVPQQPIQLLAPVKGMALANGNTSLAAIAQVRIVKQ